jgi:tRNA G10  N-methylase Trm11
MAAGDPVNVLRGKTPDDYHCDCEFCKRVIGELRAQDGSYYSRLERRQYYDRSESGKEGHIAKTPLHVARWAVQEFTAAGDWVLDPTIGAGTTAVEAITQGRNVAGMELQFADILYANIKKNPRRDDVKARIRIGDARSIGAFLDVEGFGKTRPKFKLVVNNPPYSGDEHAGTGFTSEGGQKTWTTPYKGNLPNLAFLKEGREYWETLGKIYSDCAARLDTGGHFVVAVKDMMRARKPFFLHRNLCEVLRDAVGLEFVGTAFLRHHPGTLFLHTYEKRYGIPPPYYQTISVFKKGA